MTEAGGEYIIVEYFDGFLGMRKLGVVFLWCLCLPCLRVVHECVVCPDIAVDSDSLVMRIVFGSHERGIVL